MIKVYEVHQYLRNGMRKDDFPILLCKDFMSKNPLCWIKQGSDYHPEYLACDDEGRSYICIVTSEDGNGWQVKKGDYLNDDIHLMDPRAYALFLSDAFEFATEVLLKRHFCVNPHTFTQGAK